MNIRDIIPHVSVSDIILKNKEKHHGKHGINPVNEQKIKTFWVEVYCDYCEDGKVYRNMHGQRFCLTISMKYVNNILTQK